MSVASGYFGEATPVKATGLRCVVAMTIFLFASSSTATVSAQEVGVAGDPTEIFLPFSVRTARVQDLSHPEPSRCQVIRIHDVGGDRVPERVNEYKARHDGRPVQKTVADSDGRIIEIEYWRHGLGGRRLRNVVDSNNDGLPDRLSDYLYDDQGQLSQRREDRDADGIWDFTYHFTYQADGLLVFSAVEDHALSVLRDIVHYHHDVDGNVTRVDTDYSGDGVVDFVEYRSWRGGLHVESRFDKDPDGVIDFVLRMFYDDRGREVRVEIDADGDGMFEDVDVVLYLEGKLIERRDRYIYGTWNSGQRFEYDDEGRMIVHRDVRLGSPDVVVWIRYVECDGVPELRLIP